MFFELLLLLLLLLALLLLLLLWLLEMLFISIKLVIYKYVGMVVCYCAFIFLERTVMYSFNKKRIMSRLSFGSEKSLSSKENDSSNLRNAFLKN